MHKTVQRRDHGHLRVMGLKVEELLYLLQSLFGVLEVKDGLDI